MKICGLQKTTLLDFPGHVAATIFLGACNFRCPFCHNKDLLGEESCSEYTVEEVLSFLNKRRNILEGVCITGGEPTLSTNLEEFIQSIRALGLLVKLDTNGYRPDILKTLCKKGLIGYVAMDIKSSSENYALAAGLPGLELSKIEESIEFLKQGATPYEFRTTTVKGIHSADDFIRIGPWLHGCSNYFLQNYVAPDNVNIPGVDCFTKEELLVFVNILKPFISSVSLRGISYE